MRISRLLQNFLYQRSFGFCAKDIKIGKFAFLHRIYERTYTCNQMRSSAKLLEGVNPRNFNKNGPKGPSLCKKGIFSRRNTILGGDRPLKLRLCMELSNFLSFEKKLGSFGFFNISESYFRGNR